MLTAIKSDEYWDCACVCFSVQFRGAQAVPWVRLLHLSRRGQGPGLGCKYSQIMYLSKYKNEIIKSPIFFFFFFLINWFCKSNDQRSLTFQIHWRGKVLLVLTDGQNRILVSRFRNIISQFLLVGFWSEGSISAYWRKISYRCGYFFLIIELCHQIGEAKFE